VLVVVTIGLLVGVPAAASATRIAEALLFGVTRSDPVTLAFATSLLAATALVAGFVPARAAAQINPTVALREGCGLTRFAAVAPHPELTPAAGYRLRLSSAARRALSSSISVRCSCSARFCFCSSLSSIASSS